MTEAYPPDDPDGPARQPRCLGCLREHYVLSVLAISNGEIDCGCGHVTEPMTERQYRAALARRRAGQPLQ